MKNLLLFPALLFGCFANAQAPLTALTFPPLPVQNALERGNALLRIDSIYQFSFESATDSVLRIRTRFEYFGDTLSLITKEQNQASSGFSPEPQSKEQIRWDAQGRSISNSFSFWNGTEYEFANAYDFFWHGNSTEVYDSVYTYTPQNGVVFNSSRSYYEFLEGTELIAKQIFVWLDAAGNVIQTSQTQTDYNPDQKPSQAVTSTVFPDGSEQIEYRTTYTYAGDTVTTAGQLYESSSGTWLTANQKNVEIVAPGSGLTLSLQAYELTIAGDAYRLVAEILYTYDLENRLTALEAYGYFTQDTQRVRNTYAYLSGNTILQTARFSRSSATTPWQIQQKDYYFYPEVSGTHSLAKTVSVKAAPNPATDAVWLDAGTQAIQAVRVFDPNGRLVRTLSGANQPTVALERSGLPAGVYRVQVHLANGAATVTVVFR